MSAYGSVTTRGISISPQARGNPEGPVLQTQVSKRLSDLRETVDGTEKLIGKLEERLGAILRREEPNAVEELEKEKEMSVPLAVEITTQALKLTMINEHIQNIIDRLEL